MSYADLIKQTAEQYANTVTTDERLKLAQTLAALEQAAAYEAMSNTCSSAVAHFRSFSTFFHEVTSKWARAGEKAADALETPNLYNGYTKSSIPGVLGRIADAIEKRLQR